MYNLSKKEKLNFILEKVSEMNLSAYTISQNTTLTEAGVARILKGLAKNPHENSLNAIIEFLEVKVLGSEIGKVAEPKEEYKKIDSEGYKNCLQDVNKYMREVIMLQNILRENNIPFKNIFDEE